MLLYLNELFLSAGSIVKQRGTMQFIETFKKIFTLPDLRKKIIYALVILVIVRILAHIPLPGVDLTALQNFFSRNQYAGLLNMFSGGAMENFSIIMMGVGPYITASIVMQLVTMIVPSLDELNKEGEAGRAKITQWTRLLTVPLAILQSYSMVRLLQTQGLLANIAGWEWLNLLVFMTAGTILLMWLGELITENGIGNGVSLIIALGIIAGIPTQIRNTAFIVSASNIFTLILFAAVAILVVVAIIIANEGTRQVPVSYARRVRGLKAYGGIDTYLPIRVNSAGVIPIIFAMSIMLVPQVVGQFFRNARSEWLANASTWLLNVLTNNFIYGAVYFVLIVLFTYFYTGVVLKPDQMSENLQKQGGFIPGIRPGKETSVFLSGTISRLTLTGAVFLGLIAVLPFIMQGTTNISTIAVGGTGVLIMVSVIIETMRQIQAQLSMRSYENY